MRWILAVCLFVSGCALYPPQKATPLGPAEVRSAQAAAEAIAIGKSTKADVRAALGEAVVIDFESGYAVWVYREQLREKMKSPATELVLLFDPSGLLTKTRTR